MKKLLPLFAIFAFSACERPNVPENANTKDFNDIAFQRENCSPLFAIRKGNMSTKWELANQALMCTDTLNSGYYWIDTDAIGELESRINWNRANQDYIDFNVSGELIAKRHAPHIDAVSFSYQTISENAFKQSLGLQNWANTYEYFAQITKSNGSIVIERTTDYSQRNVFSLPFLTALFTRNSGSIGVYIHNDGSVHLSSGSHYYNISNDPSK